MADNEVSSKHPAYEAILPDWEIVRDALDGETTVKDKGTDYLPMPSGFKQQDDQGVAMYEAYKKRAKFPEILAPTIRGMVGIVHRVAAEIELPAQLESLREAATKDGLPLTALHERITYELLGLGRYGLLVDAPGEGGDVPFIAGYRAETIINWSDNQDFYVLDETHLEREGFEWVEQPQFRVLELKGNQYEQQVWQMSGSGVMAPVKDVVPQMRGGKKLTDIPFVTIGSTDVTPEIDEIPLLSVARGSFTMYRLYADYFHQLYMSGQETLFVYTDGQNEVKTVGAGVVVNLPSESEAEYVGPSGEGIQAHKEAITDEKDAAMLAGARIFDTTKKTAESGEALRMRWAAQTASLTTVAINSAKGLERALKFAALYVGANPDEVVVTPNLRFIDQTLDPLKAKALVEMWTSGAISGETLWMNLQRGDIADYETTWEEEQEKIKQEIPDVPPPREPTGSKPPSAKKEDETALGQGDDE